MFPIREYASKEIALFEGIVTLLNEGKSIYELKIADIACAAGMGKGTAYEYFSSKEEIIQEAIRYQACLEFTAYSHFLSEADGFVTQLEKTMDYIVDMIANRFSSLLIMALSLNFSDIRKLACEDKTLAPAIEKEFNKQMARTFETGKNEKLIGAHVTSEECYLVLNGLYSAFSQKVRFLIRKDTIVFDEFLPVDQPKKAADEDIQERIQELKKSVIQLTLKALS